MDKISVVAFVLLFITSCKTGSEEPDIAGKWDFRHMYNIHAFAADKDELTGVEQILDLNNSKIYGSYYVFDKDHTFRALHTNRNNLYTSGRWSYRMEDSMIVFDCKEVAQPKKIKFIYCKNDQLSLMDDAETTFDPDHIYVNGTASRERNRYKFVRDPFTIGSDMDYTKEEINTWRTRPTKSEDDVQIKKRLMKSLAYAAMFLKNNIKQNGQNFRISGMDLPLLFTYKGIELKSFESSTAWQNTYFDQNAASHAYRMLLDASNTLYPPNSNQPKDLNLFYIEKLIYELNKK